MTKAQIKEAERNEALADLRKILRPGDTVHTALRHVSSSGMYRAINVYLLKPDGRRNVTVHWLSSLVARALGYKYDDKREAVGVGGCGMDMGFEVVYNLSAALFPKAERPGYALNHKWL